MSSALRTQANYLGGIKLARKILIPLMTALAFLLFSAASAKAEFGIVPGSFKVEVSDTQASGHPDITTKFELNNEDIGGLATPIDNVKDIVVDVPPGLIGNPQNMPQCDPSQLDVFLNKMCPYSTQVGTAHLKTSFISTIQAPVFNMVPAEGEVAQFSFIAVLFQIQVTASIRSDDDYGLRMTIKNTPTLAPLWSSELTFWGVPNSPANDQDRAKQCIDFGFGGTQCVVGLENRPYPPEGIPAQGQVVPFNLAPSECGAATTAHIRVNSWQDPDTWHSDKTTVEPMEGCDRMPFRPQIDAQPTTTRAGAPTGLAVDIDVPQNDAPNGVSTPPLKKVVVTLPEGMAVSPSGSDGLAACSDEQIGVGSLSQPRCPEASVIGDVSIDSPLQAEPMNGSIYLGTQTPSNLLRLFLYAEGGGVQLKLPGVIDLDPKTGQLTTTFDNQPMLASRKVSLRFKDGPRAVLSNPTTCGVKTVTSEITSHGGVVATPSSTFTITGDGAGGDCAPQAFKPEFVSGTDNRGAGNHSKFTLAVSRGDTDAQLKTLQQIDLPNGLLAKVASVQPCAEADAAAGNCGESSRIGYVQIAAGAGATPFWVPQAGKAPTAVYLTGPYRGAPYGLSIVVPAQAGPLDLGRVVVRNALHVDERTTKLTTGVAESHIYDTDGSLVRTVEGEIPTILKGIPLNLRQIRVIMDRDEFMINPTNCAPMEVGTQAVSISNLVADLSSRFQVANCAKLGFAPRFNIRIMDRGRRSTLRSWHPQTRFAVSARRGDANLRTARVVLPSSMILDQANLDGFCRWDDLQADNCPRNSIVGQARAWSPLLNRVIQGPVYLAANLGARPLPDLVAVMDGEIRVRLLGEIRTIRRGRIGRLQTTFRTIPDAPITRFVLTMLGGKNRGLLVNSTDLCRTNERGVVAFRGQNGRAQRLRPRIATTFRGCAKVRRQVARRANARKAAAARAAGSRATSTGKRS